jgi:glycosyltransferase involved in cell wall biosynthesis
MNVSIITAVFNNKSHIADCITSVLNQSYKNIEYIIIDGGSTDGTRDVIKKYDGKISKWISEPDNGIYDALNKGIKLASGDVIGFLHADDVFAHNNIIETIVSEISKRKTDSCYSDLVYVESKNIDKVIRYWKSCPYNDTLFYRGWMPPHPTFFVKKEIYDKYGSFNTHFKIASDYELMLRFLVKYRISTVYIPEVLIKMRMGGTSNRSLRNMFIKTSEDYRAWRINGLERKVYTIPFKNLSKIPQFFKKNA